MFGNRVHRAAGTGLILVIGTLLALVDVACEDDNVMTGNKTPVTDTTWHIDTVDYAGGSVQIISGFVKPYGFAVGSDGRLFVPDLEEGRVIRFTPALGFDGWLGSVQGVANSASGWHRAGVPSRGEGSGQLYMPHSVAFDQSGDLVIADYMPTSMPGRIHRYDAGGTYLGPFFQNPGDTSLSLQGISNVYVDAQFNWWVADFDGHRIFKFRPDRSLVGWIGMRDDSTATDGFATSGRAIQSTSLGGFFKPHMVLVDDTGNIYVAETGNHRIQKFDSSGRAVGWIGARDDGTIVDGWVSAGLSGPSSLPGGFLNPVSIRPLGDDTLLVADNGNHRIQKFTLDGHFVSWLGGKAGGGLTTGWETSGLAAAGTAAGAFDTPFDAQVYEGRLFVADGHNGRIQILDFE
jgi:hypothetical protein